MPVIPKEQFNRLGRLCCLVWTSTPGSFSVGRALPPRDLIDSFEPEKSSGRPSFCPCGSARGERGTTMMSTFDSCLGLSIGTAAEPD